MIRIENIHPLTDFVRNAKAHADRIRETKTAEILTINGRPELVVQDAATYEAMIDELERARFLNALMEGEREIAEGKISSLSEVRERISKKYGF